MKAMMKGSLLAASLLTAGFILIGGDESAYAMEAARRSEPLALQKIMKDLGERMQTVTDGISREDWALVERTAPLIADHQQPPLAEKARILKFIGADAGRFRGYDTKTHEAAQALAEAAKRKDGAAVIDAFRDVQLSCLSCHRAFRRSFLEHFYGSTQ